jgi:uncharacterized protein with gpF-like domain
VQQQFLNNEKEVLKLLKNTYTQSQKDVEKKIAKLEFDINGLQQEYDWAADEDKAGIQSKIQAKIYQKQYQEALHGQIDTILDNLHTKAYKGVDDYLKHSYEDGFIGTMYDLHGQGIPLIMPIDQQAVTRAVQLDSKISKNLYSKMGENVQDLKKNIAAEVSRGIVNGASYADVAQQIKLKMTGTYNTNGGAMSRAMTIARTEGHRVQVQAGFDACYAAKDMGANVLKQWDSTLDNRTRPTHRVVDGEIRELDKPFSNGLQCPGDSSGGAAEVVNCRCALLQRAKWALDEEELETLKKRAEYYGLDKTENFEDFKKKYLNAVEKVENEDLEYKISKEKNQLKDYEEQFKQVSGGWTYDEIINDFGSLEDFADGDDLENMEAIAGKVKSIRERIKEWTDKITKKKQGALTKTGNYVTMKLPKPSEKARLEVLGGAECWIEDVSGYGFPDGARGIKKTAAATIYTTPDNTRFVYPKNYNKTNQTLSPELAIEAWTKVPENVRTKIQKTVHVVDYYNPQDAYWRKKYKNFSHSYATGGEEITIYRNTRHNLEYLVQTYCHEGGHYIDANLPGASLIDRYSEQKEWQNAMKQDLKTSKKKSWRKYGENSATEDFADSVAYYTLNHEEFTKTFPERSKLLEKILK